LNDTGGALEEVRIGGAEGFQSLGSLPAGGVSSWHPVETVHRYPAIEASGHGVDLVHLPYEGDAQPDLPSGRYTYALRLEGGRLVVGLEHED
jgi:hypothetical protein